MELAAAVARATATRATVTRGIPESIDRAVPLLPAFESLLPQGLPRGSVVACEGPAAVSLALAAIAGPVQHGAWAGFAGLPWLGLAAAAELGVPLERVVAVHAPDPCTDTRWAELAGVLVDGFDVVVLGPELHVLRPAVVRRLQARLQARGAVAITIGLPAFGSDVVLAADEVRWVGLGDGHGVARGRVAQVECRGRRIPRVRQATWWLPTPDGQVCTVDDVPALSSTWSLAG